jgi:hypothetical protein
MRRRIGRIAWLASNHVGQASCRSPSSSHLRLKIVIDS